MKKVKARSTVKASKDKQVFKNTSVNRKKINVSPPLYRGGIRL